MAAVAPVASALGSTREGDGMTCVNQGAVGQQQPVLSRKHRRFDQTLAAQTVDKKNLAELAWSGVPKGINRCVVWQMLLSYRPLTHERCAEALQRKRAEYSDLRANLYEQSLAVQSVSKGLGMPEGLSCSPDAAEVSLLRQIRKDLPRTRLRSGALPAEKLVEHPRIQAMMERVLFVWAVRQPASGYVQGLNDVLLPLIVVCLSQRSGGDHASEEFLNAEMLETVDEEQLAEVEADCYWCITKILSEIFDHYTHGQPGIQRMVCRLKEIIRRIDTPLTAHLNAQGMDLLHVAFRWITCLMVRELPMPCCLRLWDALIAESALHSASVADHVSAGFEALLVYFCACFAAYFGAHLQTMDFEAMTFFLQQMPTDTFTEEDVGVLLGEAYVLKSLFQQAPRHLSNDPLPSA